MFLSQYRYKYCETVSRLASVANQSRGMAGHAIPDSGPVQVGRPCFRQIGLLRADSTGVFVK